MKLRGKIILILVSMGGIFVVSWSLIFQNILLRNFENLEDENVKGDAKILVNTISRELDRLDNNAKDWAGWDETYTYMQGTNSNYLTSNYPDSTFPLIEVSTVAIADKSGKLVFTKSYDFSSEEIRNTPAELITFFQQVAALGNNDLIFKNLVKFDGTSALVSIHPIYKSDQTGPSMGLYMFARFIDEKFLATIDDLNFPEVTFAESKRDLLSKVDIISGELRAEGGIVSRGQEVVSQVTLFDQNSKEAIVLNLEIFRPEFEAINQAMALFLIFRLVAFSIGLFVLYLLLDKLVLSRILRLENALATDDMSQLDYKNDDNKDEITNLTQVIQQHFEKLKGSLKKVSEEKIEVEEKSKELEMMNDLMVGREEKMIHMKEKIHELETKVKNGEGENKV